MRLLGAENPKRVTRFSPIKPETETEEETAEAETGKISKKNNDSNNSFILENGGGSVD
jgi:hypothetical protein